MSDQATERMPLWMPPPEPIARLLKAAKEGDIAAAESLVRDGVGITSCSNQGFTPLLNAIRYGRHEFIEWAIRNGADVNQCDYYGGYPIMCTVLLDDERSAEILLRHGAAFLTQRNMFHPIGPQTNDLGLENQILGFMRLVWNCVYSNHHSEKVLLLLLDEFLRRYGTLPYESIEDVASEIRQKATPAMIALFRSRGCDFL
jgi:ankyrin repeat protein